LPAVTSGGTGGKKGKKKRRLLNTSFQEQALRRWSARMPSQRPSLPSEQLQQQKQSPSAHGSVQEIDDACGQELGDGGSSATLQSIVDYFGGGSSDGDTDTNDGVPEEEGAGKNDVVWGKATQDGDAGEHFRPSYLLEKRAIPAPLLHGEELADDRCVSGFVAGVDTHAFSDDDLVLVDRDDEEVDNGEGTLIEGSEEEMYEDYAASTANSSHKMDSVVDQGSKVGRYNGSMRGSSVNTIVKTLRNSLQGSCHNVVNEGSNAEDFVEKLGPVLLPWEREEDDKEAFGADGRSNTEIADRTIPEHELQRLRDMSLRMKDRMMIGPGGVTQDDVESIHRKWKVDDVVKMRFEGPPSLNMKRAHYLLEVPNTMVHVYLQFFQSNEYD
jgi:hypothetical protein